MKNTSNNVLSVALAALLFTSIGCKKKTDDATVFNYTVPTAYNQISAVDYSEQTIRLNMFKSIEAEMKKGAPATGTHTLDATKLKNMFANVGSPFTDSTSWNSLPINLKDHTSAYAQIIIDGILDAHAQASAQTSPATYGDGTGTGTSGLAATSATAKILLSSNGINQAQAFQKVLFGSLLVYQINTILSTVPSLDNSVYVSGKGYSAQEHAWDQAFGYLGFSKNYTVDSLSNATFVAAHKSLYFYIANYSTQVDGGIQSSQALLNAFLKGRAAITNKDDATRDAQIGVITAELEKFLAACVIHEINELTADNNAKFLDPAKKCSSLSESWGFLNAVLYNPKRATITDAQVEDILSHYHTNSNLNNVTLDDVRYIKNTISDIYGLTSLKDVI